MDIVNIKVENGFFVSADEHIDTLELTRSKAIGWDCTIDSDGTIKCKIEGKCTDGILSTVYTINSNGYAKLTQKVQGRKVEVLKSGYVSPKGTKILNGTLFLCTYTSGKGYAFFEDNGLQDFMNKFGFSSIKNESPNGIFLGTVYTDGEKNWTFEGFTNVAHEIKNATYTVNITNGMVTLYTEKKNVQSLKEKMLKNKELSEYVRKMGYCVKLNELNRNVVQNLEDVRKNVLWALEVDPDIKLTLNETNVKFAFDRFKNCKSIIEICGIIPPNNIDELQMNLVFIDKGTIAERITLAKI